MHIENRRRQYFRDRVVVGGYAIDPGVRRVLWSPGLHLRLMQKRQQCIVVTVGAHGNARLADIQ